VSFEERSKRIVGEFVAHCQESAPRFELSDLDRVRLVQAIVTAQQAASNEAAATARGKQIPWIMDEIVSLTKRAWPEDAAGSRATQKSQSCQITEEHGELLGALRSLHGRRLSPEKTGSRDKVREEVGDLLVSCLKMAWACEVDPAEGIEVALAKVRRRIEEMEARQ